MQSTLIKKSKKNIYRLMNKFGVFVFQESVDPALREKSAPTTTESPKPPRAPATPPSDTDSTTNSSVPAWANDGSGFLSPSATPALKEVMDMMEGVSSG